MKKRFVILCVYFGKLHPLFELWLNSCAYNDSFDFILFTDQDVKVDVPSNVSIVYMSFEKLKKHFQSRLDYGICLDTPYKLCDYKPTYGYMFDEFVHGYDYWGYCDMDMIFGDISMFMPDEIDKYQKISYLGHLSMYKNDDRINKAFSKRIGPIGIQEVLSSPINFGMDEVEGYGINSVLEKMSCNIFDFGKCIADVSPRYNSFFLSNHSRYDSKLELKKCIFAFDNGKILRWTIGEDETQSTEFAYLHIQKRKMHVGLDIDKEKFLIVPNNVIAYESPSVELVNKYNKDYSFSKELFHIKMSSGTNWIKRKAFIGTTSMKDILSQ